MEFYGKNYENSIAGQIEEAESFCLRVIRAN
jgi:hypothetical protein